MTITAVIQSGEPNVVIALPDGREFGSVGEACRALIGDGTDPATQITTVWADGRTSMHGTVEGFAARVVAGGDSEVRATWWAPHPQANVPAALTVWHAGVTSRRAEVAVRRKTAQAAVARSVGAMTP